MTLTWNDLKFKDFLHCWGFRPCLRILWLCTARSSTALCWACTGPQMIPNAQQERLLEIFPVVCRNQTFFSFFFHLHFLLSKTFCFLVFVWVPRQVFFGRIYLGSWKPHCPHFQNTNCLLSWQMRMSYPVNFKYSAGLLPKVSGEYRLRQMCAAKQFKHDHLWSKSSLRLPGRDRARCFFLDAEPKISLDARGSLQCK